MGGYIVGSSHVSSLDLGEKEQQFLKRTSKVEVPSTSLSSLRVNAKENSFAIIRPFLRTKSFSPWSMRSFCSSLRARYFNRGLCCSSGEANTPALPNGISFFGWEKLFFFRAAEYDILLGVASQLNFNQGSLHDRLCKA